MRVGKQLCEICKVNERCALARCTKYLLSNLRSSSSNSGPSSWKTTEEEMAELGRDDAPEEARGWLPLMVDLSPSVDVDVPPQAPTLRRPRLLRLTCSGTKSSGAMFISNVVEGM